MLESGLSEKVADEESLARFLTQKDHYGKSKQPPHRLEARASGFLPYPKYKNTSVFRKHSDITELQKLWETTNTSGRSLKGIAFVVAGVIRKAHLEITPEEPPPAHANIERWPWFEDDSRAQKSEQLEMATQIASAADVILV